MVRSGVAAVPPSSWCHAALDHRVSSAPQLPGEAWGGKSILEFPPSTSPEAPHQPQGGSQRREQVLTGLNWGDQLPCFPRPPTPSFSPQMMCFPATNPQQARILISAWTGKEGKGRIQSENISKYRKISICRIALHTCDVGLTAVLRSRQAQSFRHRHSFPFLKKNL